jgi:hypothetical protein
MVKLVRVDVETRKIDLVPVDGEDGGDRRRGRR